MATGPLQSEPTLDIREQIARIDRIQAELSKWQLEMVQTLAQTAKTEQETRLAPLQVAFTGLGAGAALFAAGVAFAKYFVG